MSENEAINRTPQEEALTAEIEQTRQQLGETVEALAAKADVKARAQRRAAEVTGNLSAKARAVKDKVTEQATAKAVQAKETAAAKAAGVRDTAQASSAPARKQAAARAAEAGRAVRNVTPAPVQRSARQAADTVRAHPGTVAAVASALILAWLAVRRLRRP